MATFGQTGTGTAEPQAGGNIVRGSKFTLSEQGNISAISLYARVDAAGTVNIKYAIYSDNAGTPEDLLFTSEAVGFTNTSKQWVTANVSPAQNLTAGTYWIMWNNDAGTGGGGLWYGAYTLTSGEKYDGETYPGFPDPFVLGGTLNNEVSIYATYTAGGPLSAAQIIFI